jgi:hypothetical protein
MLHVRATEPACRWFLLNVVTWYRGKARISVSSNCVAPMGRHLSTVSHACWEAAILHVLEHKPSVPAGLLAPFLGLLAPSGEVVGKLFWRIAKKESRLCNGKDASKARSTASMSD